jgi:hypothetical protein
MFYLIGFITLIFNSANRRRVTKFSSHLKIQIQI